MNGNGRPAIHKEETMKNKMRCFRTMVYAVLFTVLLLSFTTSSAQQAGSLSPFWKMGKFGLLETIRQWEDYFWVEHVKLGLTQDQLNRILSILGDQKQFRVRKESEQRILLIGIEKALLDEKVDLAAVEEKVKAIESLDTEIIMNAARSFERVLEVLSPEQRKTAKTFFQASIPR
jgi:Spy/CpxP family protein refolding chaperone